MQEHCHTKLLATRYSLLAAVLPFATRYSPFANSLFASRYSLPFFSRLADLPISRFADKIRLGGASPSHSLPHRLKSVATKRSPLKQAERLEGASPDAPNFSAVREHCPPDKIIRHSLPFSFC
jgi:hypothetical protein